MEFEWVYGTVHMFVVVLNSIPKSLRTEEFAHNPNQHLEMFISLMKDV